MSGGRTPGHAARPRGRGRPGHMLERWKTFLREVRAEIKKVTWPKRKEVYGTTVVVIVTCVIFGAYLWLVDVVMGWVLTRLYAVLG